MKNILLLALTLLAVACGTAPKATEEKSLIPDQSNFDTIVDGKEIALYVLTNDNGISVALCNYGARVVSIVTPDKNGNEADIAFGFNTIEEYFKDPIYSGPIVGRFANRIGEATFTLNDEAYELFKNDGNNTLHGGKKGIDKVIWDAKEDSNSVTFSYLSPDGEEGYPGNLQINATYTLTDADELKIEYSATTDAPTVVNLTNHTYMNLKGEGDSTINDHYLMINADAFTAVDDEWIPTGELTPVGGTPFDFRDGKLIGQDLELESVQLANGKGYDHNWVLNTAEEEVPLALKVWEETTGRYIKVYTSEPGIQLYGGNFLNGTLTGKSGQAYKYRAGFIFEPQHFPDSPNQVSFPSTVLNPGDEYTQVTILKFGVKE